MEKKEYFENIADDVQFVNFDRPRQLLEQRRAEIAVELLDVKAVPLAVLDVGCGEGLQLSRVHRVNPLASLVGLDLSEKRLSLARQRVPSMTPVCADLEMPLPLEPGRFDRILCSEVLEHLIAPAELLTRLRGLLKPGGILVITVPYRQLIRYVRCVHCGQLTNEHRHSFSEDGIAVLLAEAGFELKRVLIPRLYWLTRTAFLPYRVWRRVHRLLESTVLRGGKPAYMFCVAQ